MSELDTCIACGAEVPEKQYWPFDGHTKNCYLVCEWLEEIEADMKGDR